MKCAAPCISRVTKLVPAVNIVALGCAEPNLAERYWMTLLNHSQVCNSYYVHLAIEIAIDGSVSL